MRTAVTLSACSLREMRSLGGIGRTEVAGTLAVNALRAKFLSWLRTYGTVGFRWLGEARGLRLGAFRRGLHGALWWLQRRWKASAGWPVLPMRVGGSAQAQAS